eukprot:TRINITY_DN17307_c0_g1_i2.p1 TRINITY_DN17307_c0_g1~~TRINITY_DN17307_c0_g1_i2.p1  ORF type:complete len:220 (-),score=38.05 TRINITY_DN17307_c0_g1_i2:229-888(-)
MVLASGVDGERSHLFVQSAVPYHLKLYWILSCCTSNNWINRMPQYKQKQREGIMATLGLYTYPVLMAADVLAYNAQMVPVGEDQKLHMELVRLLADRMNQLCKREIFNRPELFIPPYVAEYRVMSLQDGTKKMSKSSGTEDSIIFLTDTDDAIKKKILGAKVDRKKEIYFDKENRPEVANLMRIFATAHNMQMKNVGDMAKSVSMLEFKAELAKKLIEM